MSPLGNQITPKGLLVNPLPSDPAFSQRHQRNQEILDAYAWEQWAWDRPASYGLTFAYKGGVVPVGGTPTRVVDGTILLEDNTTNYVERDVLGTVSVNVVGFSSDMAPMAKVTTRDGIVEDVEDWRMVSSDPADGAFTGTIDASQVVSGILPAARGGTDQGAPDLGDLLVGGPGAWFRKAAVVGGMVLLSTGVAVPGAPAWGLVTNAHITPLAGIEWTKLSKVGSSLAHLETRSAADLTSGNLAYARMPNIPGTWAVGGALSITGGVTTVAGLISTAPTGNYIGASAYAAATLGVGGAQIQLVLAENVTDATQKVARFGAAHYTNAEEPMAILIAVAGVVTNTLSLGGGSSLLNAAGVIRFYTAATNTTTTGTIRGIVNASGNWTLGAVDGTGAGNLAMAALTATTGDFSSNTEVAGVLTLKRTDPILNFSDVSSVLRVRLTSPSANSLLILNSAANAGAAVSMGALTATTGAFSGLLSANLGLTVGGGDLTVSSAQKIVMGTAASQIVPGATSFALRNNLNSADNLLVTDAGAVTVRLSLTVMAGVTATAGDIRLPNAIEGIMARNAANSANIGMLRTTGDNAVSVGWTGASIITFGDLTAGTPAMKVTPGAGVQIGAPTGGDKGAGTLNLDADLYKDGVKVVGAQGAAVADSTGILLDLTTQFNVLLARIRTHGLIAT